MKKILTLIFLISFSLSAQDTPKEVTNYFNFFGEIGNVFNTSLNLNTGKLEPLDVVNSIFVLDIYHNSASFTVSGKRINLDQVRVNELPEFEDKNLIAVINRVYMSSDSIEYQISANRNLFKKVWIVSVSSGRNGYAMVCYKDPYRKL